MFGLRRDAVYDEAAATLTAIKQSQGFIEFSLDGTILTANENFLNVVGYTLLEIQGQHHSLFVAPAYRDSTEYRTFWNDLSAGKFKAAQFQRHGKNSREVWIEASYNPVFDSAGKPYKIVKLATDITKQKQEYADFRGQLEAIGKAHAVIEFELDGTILKANANFLNALGYTLDEIKGRHHSIFVNAEYKNSPEYQAFWQKLRRGEFEAGRFKRFGKGGKTVWIAASYNLILDPSGKPFKVVKYATDITPQMELFATLSQNLSEIEFTLGISSDEANQVAHTVEETTESVQIVASSIEEMAASVREISDIMATARLTTENVHESSRMAEDAARRLSATSDGMFGIVGLIRTIASRLTCSR